MLYKGLEARLGVWFSGRAIDSDPGDPGFDPQHHQKKKKKRELETTELGSKCM